MHIYHLYAKMYIVEVSLLPHQEEKDRRTVPRSSAAAAYSGTLRDGERTRRKRPERTGDAIHARRPRRCRSLPRQEDSEPRRAERPSLALPQSTEGPSCERGPPSPVLQQRNPRHPLPAPTRRAGASGSAHRPQPEGWGSPPGRNSIDLQHAQHFTIWKHSSGQNKSQLTRP